MLSAGHGSMLLYSLLHLTGFEAMTMDQIKRFRQWGSLTPGHPEYGHTVGVETTTGPLGAGFGNAVGMAMAEKFLREKFGAEISDHHIFGICSDGDLMEGVSAEAASLAGHLGLGRLIFVYDDNTITIDGNTDISFSGEDVPARFRAYGWHTLTVEDGNDLEAIEAAIRAGIAEEHKPTLISLKTIIGYGSPNKQGTHKAHSDAFGVEEVRNTKENLGWDPDKDFFIPDEVYAHWRDGALERGRELGAQWSARFEAWSAANPELAKEWAAAQTGKAAKGFGSALPEFDVDAKIGTRVAGATVMQALAPFAPTMMGGAADLVASTGTTIVGAQSFTREHAGQNVHWGIREHAMGAAVNGLALHGGIVKPYGSTFFVFTDYMRPAIRLSALMNLGVVWIFTHDSVAVGEDGPTHQPIEHLAAMRAIPGLTVIRPADATETAAAWKVIAEDLDGPACLVLSRQVLPVLDRSKYPSASGLERGAYVLSDTDAPQAILVATGGEVSTALEAQEVLAGRGIHTRVVSMPSWELFDAQSESYRSEILPAGVPTISVEAGSSQGWAKYAGHSIAIDTFGASGPGGKVLAHFGFTGEAIADRVEAIV